MDQRWSGHSSDIDCQRLHTAGPDLLRRNTCRTVPFISGCSDWREKREVGRQDWSGSKAEQASSQNAPETGSYPRCTVAEIVVLRLFGHSLNGDLSAGCSRQHILQSQVVASSQVPAQLPCYESIWQTSTMRLSIKQSKLLRLP
jgi:hypothetical protein